MAALQRGLNRCSCLLRQSNAIHLANSIRYLSVSSHLEIKRKWISKWKNSFPTQVYSEGIIYDFFFVQAFFHPSFCIPGPANLDTEPFFLILLRYVEEKKGLSTTCIKTAQNYSHAFESGM